MNHDISIFLASSDIHENLAGSLEENTSSYDTQGLGLVYPIDYEVDIYKVGQDLELMVWLAYSYQAQCARCTQDLVQDIETTASLRVTTDPLALDQEEEEEEFLLLDSLEVLPLGEILMSQVITSRPFKSLCKEDCKGLCPSCGQDLNVATCDCEIGSGTSPFEELRDLFKD